MKRKQWNGYGIIMLFLAVFALALSGCSGDDGSRGAPGTPGTPGADATVDQIGDVVDARLASTEQAILAAQPESCSVCHAGAGDNHQAIYDQYSDTSAFTLTIDSVVSVVNASDATKFDTTMTFTIKKDGVAYVDVDGLPTLDQKRYYAVKYDSATRVFDKSVSFSNPVALGGGQYSVKATGIAYAPELSNAEVYAYIGDDKLTTEGMQLYSNVANTGKEYGDVDTYVSAANVAGCEKCHGKPYMKHGYRAAAVAGLPDFAACKTCHYDTRTGGHTAWQLLVDDPAAYAAQDGKPTDAQKTLYAYKASVMNDVHMSHAMEFAYPQSMANCVVCHEGKLTTMTVTDANFTLTTCKSCHPQTGPAAGTDPKRAPALATTIPHAIPADGICNSCHKAGGIAPVFSAIHSGYDKKIYAAADQKYSDIFKVAIDSASLSGTDLTIKFTATKTDPTGATSLAVTSITPKVVVGLHGYDTKDYIVDAHGSDFDDNGDGKILTRNCGTACDYRNLEYDIPSANPRFTLVSAANGSWEVKVKLANWASLITDGTVKRIEIAVLPSLKNAGVNVPVNSPAKTFDIATNAFVDYFSPIVKVSNGCDNCHGALGITFHSAQYGSAGVVGCRFCHTPRSGGYHLEMQSRSIDSYVHAIHSFQAFDPWNIDFTDPVAALRYNHHIESTYPNFTITNCESCHNAGTYNVPDQSKSLGGTLSKAATWKKDRNIGAVPSYVAGPGARACGSCHRSEMINEDKAGELAALYQHMKMGGYLVEATDSTVFDSLVDKMMAIFK